MHNSSKAPRKKGSFINRITRKISPEPKTPEAQNTITKEYLDKYLYEPHPEQGYALNILFRSDDSNKYNVINYLASRKVDKYQALEFALLKENYLQAEDLFMHLNFEPNSSLIQAVKIGSLILAQYFVEKKGADVNFSYFGSNLLDLAINKEITNYLLEKGAKPLEMTLEKAAQEGHIEDIRTLLTKVDNNNKESAIMLAAQNGHVETVRSLLENGVDPKTQGWQTSDLYADVSFQVSQIFEVCEKINATNVDYPDLTDLTKYVKTTLKPIFLTTISSQYSDYNDISEKNILEKLPKLLQQLKKDLEVFMQIKDLLENYSSEEKVNIDDGYLSNPENDVQDQQPGKKLSEVPAASGMFRVFSREQFNEFDTDQTSLCGDVKDIFKTQFITPSE